MLPGDIEVLPNNLNELQVTVAFISNGVSKQESRFRV